MDYEQYKLKEYKYWAVYLNVNQYFLGRVYIWSKRKGLVDLMDLSEKEQKELFEICKQVKQALTELFRPDLFNWASLGNISSQCHLHVIPRYEKPRLFNLEVFVDERWGKNYAPYNYDFKISEETLLKIRDVIKEKLKAIK